MTVDPLTATILASIACLLAMAWIKRLHDKWWDRP